MSSEPSVHLHKNEQHKSVDYELSQKSKNAVGRQDENERANTILFHLDASFVF